MELGDGLPVCDCSGGTVDVMTYKIISTVTNLVFEEPVEGAGGKCGSAFIDRRFHHLWMSQKFGLAFDTLNSRKKGQEVHS